MNATCFSTTRLAEEYVANDIIAGHFSLDDKKHRTFFTPSKFYQRNLWPAVRRCMRIASLRARRRRHGNGCYVTLVCLQEAAAAAKQRRSVSLAKTETTWTTITFNTETLELREM